MKKTFRFIGAILAFALACGFGASAAFAAPPGDVTHPVNASASAVESTQATQHTAAPALAGELQGFKVMAPVMGSTLDSALSGRLRSADGWDGYGLAGLNEGTGFALSPGAPGGGSGCSPGCHRT